MELGADGIRGYEMAMGRPAGGNGSGTVAYQQPYALAYDCLLSEDHFLLQLTNLDPATDQIIGYPQDNAYTVEAMVVQDGALFAAVSRLDQ